jgi:hypothetical protein
MVKLKGIFLPNLIMDSRFSKEECHSNGNWDADEFFLKLVEGTIFYF